MDKSRSGARVRAATNIEIRDGFIRRGTQGTIQYEVNSLERHLIFVHWDSGLESIVFNEEITIDSPEGATP